MTSIFRVKTITRFEVMYFDLFLTILILRR